MYVKEPKGNEDKQETGMEGGGKKEERETAHERDVLVEEPLNECPSGGVLQVCLPILASRVSHGDRGLENSMGYTQKNKTCHSGMIYG